MKDFPFLNEAVGQVLKELRENAPLSLTRLSQLTNLNRLYLYQVENGKNRPTLNLLFILCDALKIRPARLVVLVQKRIRQLKRNQNQQ